MRSRNRDAIDGGDEAGLTSSGPLVRGFGQETDNTAKYARASGLERVLLRRFRARLLDELRALRPRHVLDAGCGEGFVTAWLIEAFPGAEITGVDGRGEALVAFRANNYRARALEADIRALPFPDNTFDLVLCTEVLEHLPEPRTVVRELSRVSAHHLFLTVPHEPFFRAGNAAAGKYLSRLGSTPGHRWTWGHRSFLRMVETEAEPVRWVSLFPWQGVLARP